MLLQIRDIKNYDDPIFHSCENFNDNRRIAGGPAFRVRCEGRGCGDSVVREIASHPFGRLRAGSNVAKTATLGWGTQQGEVILSE